MSEAFFSFHTPINRTGSQNAQTKSPFKGLFIQIIATFAKKLKNTIYLQWIGFKIYYSMTPR